MAAEETRRQKLESRNEEGDAADRLESCGTGGKVAGVTYWAASTVSLNPTALVTATSVDRRGLP